MNISPGEQFLCGVGVPQGIEGAVLTISAFEQATVPHESSEGANETVGLVARAETKHLLWDSALKNRFKPLSLEIPLPRCQSLKYGNCSVLGDQPPAPSFTRDPQA